VVGCYKGRQVVFSTRTEAQGGQRNEGAAAGGEVGVLQQDLSFGTDGEVVDLWRVCLGG
jgi:hypothetical protein